MFEGAVLGVETSCDETGLSVVEGGRVLANVLASQAELHARFGGVVPEVAARAHVESIRHLAHSALLQAGLQWGDLAGVAATQGPGLVGSLAVGFSFAKAMAWALEVPFIGINHLEGHVFSPRLEHDAFAPPAIVVLASGGHSQMILVRDWGDYQLLGETIDDAAGEAFDKVGRFLGLGYPGGPAIDRAAEGGNPSSIKFPRALADRRQGFSFSGLKTAVVTTVRKRQQEGRLPALADVAASMQEAVVDVLVERTFNAVEDTGVKVIAGGGGVLANRRLRARLTEEAKRRQLQLFLPSPGFCVDNGAMIAIAGAFRLGRGELTAGSAEVSSVLPLFPVA